MPWRLVENLLAFRCNSGVTPDLGHPPGGGYRSWFLGPSDNNFKIPEAYSRDPETETGSLETVLRVHRIHDALETDDASQPGCPSKEGRRIGI